MKVSVTVLHPGEEAKSHEGEDEDEEQVSENNLQSMVLLPPSIQTQDWEMEAKIYKAEHLPKMDTLGSVNPFVKVSFAGVDGQTKVKKGFDPVWNEQITLPVTLPSMTDLLVVEVFDHDAV